MGGKGKDGKGKEPPVTLTPEEKAAKEAEALAKKEEAKKKREEEKAAQAKQKEEEKKHMAFLEALPAGTGMSIEGVKWTEAERQVIQPGGTTVVRMHDEKLVCLQRVPSPACELVAASVARTLDLNVPNTRSVQIGGEYTAIDEMTAATPAYLDDFPMTYEDFFVQMNEANADDIPTELKSPLIAKFGYTEPVRAAKWLGCPEKPKGTVFVSEFKGGRPFSSLCGALDKKSLQTLGQIGVLGALLNQTDLMPMPVWRESGGLGHIVRLEGSQDIQVVQLQMNILTGEELDKYMERLKLLAARLTNKPDTSADPAGYTITADQIKIESLALLKKGGFEVTEVEMDEVVEGARMALTSVASKCGSSILPKALAEALAQASDSGGFDPNAPTASDCENFILATSAAIATGAGFSLDDIANGKANPHGLACSPGEMGRNCACTLM